MKKIHLFLYLIFLCFISCKKQAEIGAENELITTVRLNFRSGSEMKSFSYQDLDGEGGKAPSIDKISLSPNTTYDLTVEFLDESKNPVNNITEEIRMEGDEHLVLLTPSDISLGTYNYTDKDLNLLPLGLSGKFSTSNTAVGKLKVQLRHQPPINGKNTKDGTATPGSDDINVDFTLEIK